MSLLSKALMVAASAAFVAGASLISVPKPPAYQRRALAPEAIVDPGTPQRCADANGVTAGAAGWSLAGGQAALTPARAVVAQP